MDRDSNSMRKLGLLFTAVLSIGVIGCDKPEPSAPVSTPAPVAKSVVNGDESEIDADAIKRVEYVDGSTLQKIAIAQLSGNLKNVVGTSTHQIDDLESGYILVRKYAKLKIEAVSESPEWFLFGTTVSVGERPIFINGYAVARGGTEVIEWGTW